MADLATLQVWLADAESARQKLLTGSIEETVEHGDMRVTYTRSEADKLSAYIVLLESQIYAATVSPTPLRRRASVIDL